MKTNFRSQKPFILNDEVDNSQPLKNFRLSDRGFMSIANDNVRRTKNNRFKQDYYRRLGIDKGYTNDNFDPR